MSEQAVNRVVLVLGTSAGGVGRHVRMLAAGLAGSGRQVVVAGPPSTEDAFGFTGAGARFAGVPIADRPHPVNDLRSVARLRAVARGAGAVHAHGLRAGALAALAVSGLRKRPGLVVTLHNAVTAGGVIGLVYGVLEWIVARRADHILVVSPDLGDRMRARGARRVSPALVPAPPLRPPLRGPEEVRKEINERLSRLGDRPPRSGERIAASGDRPPGFDDRPSGAGERLAGSEPGRPQERPDRPIVLTVARLAQQKGLETLLAAAAGPFQDDPIFVIAGDGPLQPELQAEIDAKGLPVMLLGARDDIADLLQVAAVVLVPSRWEGQPLSVQEALRAGRPIVATWVGGVPDMVRDAALLVRPGDAEAMRGELAGLLGDDGLAVRLSEASARRGSELPGETDALEAVLGIYSLVSQV
jgi:glycosyltransferase involved in cell wall biosynthesis